EPVMPVLLPSTTALLLQSTQVRHRHDFAGALKPDPRTGIKPNSSLPMPSAVVKGADETTRTPWLNLWDVMLLAWSDDHSAAGAERIR
ncbi:hypothetical protein ACWD6N_07590, partial [Micromonospora sp. NPDC005163]